MAAFLKKCLKYFVFSGFFSLFINTLYLTFPLYMLAIYVRVLPGHSFPTLYAVTAIGLTALLVFGLLDFMRSRLLVQAGVAMDSALSRTVLEKMLLQASTNRQYSYSYGLKDVNQLRNFLAGNAVFAFFDIPWMPIYLAIIYLIHPALGLVATAGAVILFVLGLIQELLTRRKADEIQATKQKDGKLVSDCIRNSEMLHCMGMLRNISRHRNDLNDLELELDDYTGKKAQMIQSVSKGFRSMMQVFIFGAGALLVLKGQAHSGVIIAASIIMGRALAPVDQILGTWKQSMDAFAAYKRLDELVKKAPVAGEEKLSSPAGELEVKDVSLTFDSAPILKNISFDLHPGEFMGLIGPNGAGKSSLCRISLGIWPPDEGEVLIDGVPVFSLASDQLAGAIGYLPQDVELFPGSVAENIARMGEVDAEKCVQAAKKAGIHETLLRLPHGYETDLTASGVNLSGGQRQRVGLARALYGEPKLIFLDEPTSNLDEQAEQGLMQSLFSLREQGKAILMITHKPDLLQNMDKLLMLKKGESVYCGPAKQAMDFLLRGDGSGNMSGNTAASLNSA